jgi:hypothetical protein
VDVVVAKQFVEDLPFSKLSRISSLTFSSIPISTTRPILLSSWL